MIATQNEVITAGLTLPAKSRAEVIHRLLNSLNSTHVSDIEQAWAREAEDRLAAYERGDMQAIPAEDVYREVLAELRK